MPKTQTQRPREARGIASSRLWVILCLCVVGSQGCPQRKRPAPHIAPAVLQHPVVPPASQEQASLDPPDLPIPVMTMPERLGTPRNPPTRPHVAVAPPPEPPKEEKSTEPIIAPELSGDQLAAAKLETQQSLTQAERNLGQTQGKRLNAAQGDLVSKIRGFTEASREAMKNGDWPRARSLAKKAEVLSQELVEGL